MVGCCPTLYSSILSYTATEVVAKLMVKDIDSPSLSSNT